MSWNAAKPAGSDSVRSSDDHIRANNDALEDALSRDHVFPGTMSVDAGNHAVVQFKDQGADSSDTAGYVKMWNNGGSLNLIVPGGSVLSVVAFESGTKAWFYQDTAPEGWTIDATPADALLAVKGGTQAFNVAGGTQAGSWSHYHTISNDGAHTHTADNHTHQFSHVHLASGTITNITGTRNVGTDGVPAGVARDNHEHPFSFNTQPPTGSSTTGNPSALTMSTEPAHDHTGLTGSASTYRPLAQVGIICEKD